ncbi:transglycosylase domain-containing protein [Bacillus glycinifermentans]|uniref:Monofunctional biosynthetic peptidoglycan transglycosylase n=1 Tax=Bacillus glycinifermentans TaxID=1664069 RepID=A0A0T6BK17_9BACI|nr:PBP1A family penicillin-binding protein [Bacillus glycinifermentans]ATH93608.1 monofunctional biosynthetic peptidoglycan transglycosylase [Bacillus glycinifermentans]KRT90220.1 monofunctional biosynthetic peptidoglycan transglycosylase [Bacillus glycinifermentans]MEC0483909.1 PBP1A family penicillin-binding protein [Bacillus glycinifermentans]
MDMMTNKRVRLTIKTIRAFLFMGILMLLLLSILIMTVVLAAKWQGAPSVQVPRSTVLYDGNGKQMGETHYGQKRYWVSLDNINPAVIDATLAVEDRNFFRHHGFDYVRMAGAVIADLKAMSKVQGASTITQQYARNLYLGHDKTWKRKWNEAFYTIRLEQNYSKKDILEGYLNTIYYGHGAYGIEAASRLYFGKSAKNINTAEAAMLAGIPKGPSMYSPFVNEKKAKERQEMILTMMEKENKLTKKQAATLKKMPLTYKKREKQTEAKAAPYFYDEAVKEIARLLKLKPEQAETGGYNVYTTLDPRLQKIAEKAVKQTINPKSGIQAGFAAIDPYDGSVLALVGGRDYEKSPFNRVTQARRQPGSTMKPLLYYSAIQNGFTPATRMRSAETTFELGNGALYSPSNYHGYYADGPITLLQALALSDNIYAVKTHLFLGMDKLIDAAKRFGITSPLQKVPSLALGTSPVKPIEMVNAYAMLANGGKQIEPSFIAKITDSNGTVLYEKPNLHKQLLDPKAAFITANMMTGMFDTSLDGYTSVTGRTIAGKLTRTYAGKSGTTGTDSWMVGFYPGLASGVWTGYDKGRTIDMVEEKNYAKQIWAEFMERALAGEPEAALKPPDGVKSVYIDPSTGYAAAPGCPAKHPAYFIEGTEPDQVCFGKETYQDKKAEPENPAKPHKRKKWWEWWFRRDE